MHRNYFTLYHAARELHEQLAGGFVFEINPKTRNELSLGFVTREGRHLQIMVISGIPELCLWTREGLNRKKRHTASLMQNIYEEEVTEVEMSPFDRELFVRLAGGKTLVLRLFGTAANLLLVSRGSVVDACRNRNTLIGAAFPEPDKKKQSGIVAELELLAQERTRFIERMETPLPLPGFDRSLERILRQRWAEENDPEMLFAVFQQLFYELIDPVPQTGVSPEGQPLCSILHQPLPEAIRHSSLLECLSRYSSSTWGWLHATTTRKKLQRKLKFQLQKTLNELRQFDPARLAQRAAQDESNGHLLMGALYLERSTPESITVPDIFQPDAPDRTIRLDPAISLAENAALYFRKASKTRHQCDVILERKKKLLENTVLLESLMKELSAASSPKSVKRFLEVHTADLNETSSFRKKSGNAAAFRHVNISKQATLYIGKNAKNNDQLTFTFAKPNDIWLHARGSAGSHCLLRGVSLQQKEEIRKAAEIAARHSAAQHSELVPVMYALKKYVRRSKNLPLGQVIVEREEVILVRPAEEGV